jgi:hypothetical protein
MVNRSALIAAAAAAATSGVIYALRRRRLRGSQKMFDLADVVNVDDPTSGAAALLRHILDPHISNCFVQPPRRKPAPTVEELLARNPAAGGRGAGFGGLGSSRDRGDLAIISGRRPNAGAPARTC